MFALRNFLRCDHPEESWNKLSAQIRRLIICGNSTFENKDSNLVQRGAYRTQDLNKQVYEEIDSVQDRFEDFLNSFLDTLDVDLMPGDQDFSSAYLP